MDADRYPAGGNQRLYMAVESPIWLLCLLSLLCGPSKQGKKNQKNPTHFESPACFVFPAITRESAVRSRFSPPPKKSAAAQAVPLNWDVRRENDSAPCVGSF